jgi:hypothetical protein
MTHHNFLLCPCLEGRETWGTRRIGVHSLWRPFKYLCIAVSRRDACLVSRFLEPLSVIDSCEDLLAVCRAGGFG